MEKPTKAPSALEALPAELLYRIGEMLVPPLADVTAAHPDGPSAHAWSAWHRSLRSLAASSRRLYGATNNLRYRHVGLWKAQNAAEFLLHLARHPARAADVSQISVSQISYSDSCATLPLLPSRKMVEAYRLAYLVLAAIGPMVHDQGLERRYLQLDEWYDPDDGRLPNGTYAERLGSTRRHLTALGVFTPTAATQAPGRYFSFGYLNGVDAIRNAILCCCPQITALLVRAAREVASERAPDGFRGEYPVLCEGRTQHHRTAAVGGLRVGLPGARLEDLRLWHVSSLLPDLPRLRRLTIRDDDFHMPTRSPAPPPLPALRVIRFAARRRAYTLLQDLMRLCRRCPALEVLDLAPPLHMIPLEVPGRFSLGAALALFADTLRSLTIHAPAAPDYFAPDPGTKPVDLRPLRRLAYLKTDTGVLFGRKESGGGTVSQGSQPTRLEVGSGPMDVLALLPRALKHLDLTAKDVLFSGNADGEWDGEEEALPDLEYEQLVEAFVSGLLAACVDGQLGLETFRLSLYEPNMGVLPVHVEELVVGEVRDRFRAAGVDFQVEVCPRVRLRR